MSLPIPFNAQFNEQLFDFDHQTGIGINIIVGQYRYRHAVIVYGIPTKLERKTSKDILIKRFWRKLGAI